MNVEGFGAVAVVWASGKVYTRYNRDVLLSMIGFIALCAALAIVGSEISRRAWLRLDGAAAFETTKPLERLTAGAVIGATLWLGLNWLFALSHFLTRNILLSAAWVCVVAAIAVVPSKPIRFHRSIPSWTTLLASAAIAIWVVFILWRSVLLPPDNHDALSYHLPKAVFIAQSHGYGYFVTGDPRVTVLPANYELLLSDVLILTGTDHLTEWLSALFYILFLIATGAAIERWFGSGIEVTASVIATAACPILLLHSGADKNDLMTCFFAVASLLWFARWFANGGKMPFFLAILTLAAGAGTKPHGLAILIAIAPFALLRLKRLADARNLRWSEIALSGLVALIAFCICGGAVYAIDLLHARTGSVGTTPNFVGYGDWANLWRFPYLVLAEPFARNASMVWVPWAQEYWFWPRYEIFFSGFGPLFTILVCLIPFSAYKFPHPRNERTVFSLAALIAALLIMPLQFRPLGFFGGLARFVAFIIPAVMAYSVAPIFGQLRRKPGINQGLIIILTAYFCWQATLCAVNDRFSPLAYAKLAARTGGTRRIWFNPFSAGSIVDRLAGAHDTVAVDSGFDTWLYPAMGEFLTRKIEIIPAGAVRIPDDAQWVMVDKSWNAVWGSPALTDLGKFRGNIEHGVPSTDDTRVIRALAHDARFVLVYYDARHNQAVFRRRDR
jgi:hypothetical protein